MKAAGASREEQEMSEFNEIVEAEMVRQQAKNPIGAAAGYGGESAVEGIEGMLHMPLMGRARLRLKMARRRTQLAIGCLGFASCLAFVAIFCLIIYRPGGLVDHLKKRSSDKTVDTYSGETANSACAGTWGVWSKCSAACGGGRQIRHRANGAALCGSNESRACNMVPCPQGGAVNFSASLERMNGVPAQNYDFRVVYLAAKDSVKRFCKQSSSDDWPACSYGAKMKASCSRLGAEWKPVCENQADCGADKDALYLGHDGHLAETATRQDHNKVPGGLSMVAHRFSQLCGYIGEKPDGDAICNQGCKKCGSSNDT